MPPPVVKELKVIIHNLEQFTEKLLCRIGNEKESKRKELIDAFNDAETAYAGSGLASYIIYPFTRDRGSEVEKKKSEIEGDNSDTEKLLRDIKELITKGEWKSTSYNFGLFDRLFKIVEGYEPLPENDTIKTYIFTQVKTIMFREIDKFIRMSQHSKEERKARDAELLKTQSSNQRRADDVSISSSLERAKELTGLHPNNFHFYLSWRMAEVLLKDPENTAEPVDDKTQSEADLAPINMQAETSASSSEPQQSAEKEKIKVWDFVWIDRSGKPCCINPSDDLLGLLATVGDVEKLHPIAAKNIKQNCLVTLEQYLKRIRLLINPQNRENVAVTDEQLLAGGTSSTFVLRGRPGAYTLSWINTLGLEATPVFLELYPEFHTWLNDQESLNDEHHVRLSAYLLTVNPVQTVKNDLKNELQIRLSQAKLSQEFGLNRVHVLVNPVDAKSNIESSDEQLIADGNLSTFVVRIHEEHYDLRWINYFGVVTPIVIKEYPALEQWLKDPNALDERYIPQMKFHLLDVKISAEISVADDLKKQLELLYSDKAATSTNSLPGQASAVIESTSSDIPQAPPLPGSPMPSRSSGNVSKKLTTEQLAGLSLFVGKLPGSNAGRESVHAASANP